MIEINRPKIKYSQGNDENHGILKLEPLERGYGQTLGNAFRRVLLASLPGSAVCAVKIDGVLHEFCSVPGILEDVTEIILNLKKLIVNVHSDQPVTLHLDAQGPCEITAADLPKNPELTVIDKDVHIAHVTGSIKFGMDITFKRGRGYLLAEDHKEPGHPLGTILVDSQFSPVTKVMFNVEDARVGQEINFDKLTLQVWTNGSMKPSQSIELAAKFLKAHVDLFTNLDEEEVESDEETDSKPKEELVMVSSQKKETPQRSYNDILIKDLEFSVRSRNCLKKAGIQNLGELVNKKASELLEIKNFGKKSLKEVREKLSQFNLTLPGEENGGGIEA